MPKPVKSSKNARCRYIDAGLHKSPCVCLIFVAQNIDEGQRRWLEYGLFPITHEKPFDFQPSYADFHCYWSTE